MRFLMVLFAIVISSLFVNLTYGQDYYVLPTYLVTERSGNKLYQTPSGITIKTDSKCVITDGTPARLSTDTYTISYTDDKPVIKGNEIVYETVTIVCSVIDYMGVYKSNLMVINSNVWYDATHGYLELYNIQVTDGFKSTGLNYSRAKLLNVNGVFILEELEP